VYSQNKEEEVLANATYFIKEGYVLDIGANDGQTLSNSRALIERGWHGCMIEPDYEAFSKLAALYRDNKNIRLVQAAVDTEGGMAQLHKSSEMGLVSSLLETVNKEKFIHDYWVPKITPSQVIDILPKGPDVITIDIEGRSFDVLTKFPFGSWIVRAICVEHDNRAVEVAAWGNSIGYRTVELNAENIIMVRR